MHDIRWNDINETESELITQCAKRAIALFPELDRLSLLMDLSATHLSEPLKLYDLLNADDFNFSHDVVGIVNHLDRNKGQLDGRFLPRFAVNQ